MKCSALMETPLKQSMPGICAIFHQSDPMRSIAYTSEDIKWCEATINFLEGQLSDEALAVRSIPPAKRARHSRAAAAAPSPAPASEPPLQKLPPQRRKTTTSLAQGRQPVMTLKMTKMGLWRRQFPRREHQSPGT